MGNTRKGKIFSCFIPPHNFMHFVGSGMMQNAEFTGWMHPSKVFLINFVQRDNTRRGKVG